MLVPVIEKMPYIAGGFALLTILVVVLIPLLYTKVVKVGKRRRIRVLSRQKRQVIVGGFAYTAGLLLITCTPVIIPFADKITNGSHSYPEVAMGIVAILLLLYVVIIYAIITLTSKIRVKVLRKTSGR